jgi:hypothetical protein
MTTNPEEIDKESCNDALTKPSLPRGSQNKEYWSMNAKFNKRILFYTTHTSHSIPSSTHDNWTMIPEIAFAGSILL